MQPNDKAKVAKSIPCERILLFKRFFFFLYVHQGSKMKQNSNITNNYYKFK